MSGTFRVASTFGLIHLDVIQYRIPILLGKATEIQGFIFIDCPHYKPSKPGLRYQTIAESAVRWTHPVSHHGLQLLAAGLIAKSLRSI
jgi:hypothetical protein